MILLKSNPTADRNNMVFVNDQMDPIADKTAATLTKYSIAFTNTSDVTAFEIGGITYTLAAAIDISTAAGALALIAAIEDQLVALGYDWDSETIAEFDIDTTTTNIYVGLSQIVFDQLNATVFVAGDTATWGLS